MASSDPRRKPSAAPFTRKTGRIDPASLSQEQQAELVLKGVAATDDARSTAVLGLARARRARARQLEAEQARLRNRPDAAARCRTLARAAEANRRTLETLDAQAERDRVAVPESQEGAYRVYGLVRGADGRPVADHTITLDDADGQRIKAAGHTCTEDDGTFLLTWRRAGREPYVQSDVAQKEAEAATKAAKRAFLRVTDPAGATAYRSRRPLVPRERGVDYVEVRLGAPLRDCAEPPDDQKDDQRDDRYEQKRPPRGKGGRKSGDKGGRAPEDRSPDTP